MVFFLAGDLLDRVATFASGFIALDASAVQGVIGYVHWPATAWCGTSQMLMLEGLDESPMGFTFLL